MLYMQNRNQYVLGVLNKKTKRELDLYDIESIFNMNQKIRKIEQDHPKFMQPKWKKKYKGKYSNIQNL